MPKHTPGASSLEDEAQVDAFLDRASSIRSSTTEVLVELLLAKVELAS